jgi:hypothetical protein
MAMDFSVSRINRAISEDGLDDVCTTVELEMSKSKTVTVSKYVVTPAVPAVMETRVKTPAVDAVDAISAVPAVDAVMGERHKHAVTQEDVTTTETVTVKEGSKWVQKEVSTTVTNDVYTPQYKEVDLWDDGGKKKIGKYQESVMESYEVSPAVSAISAVSAVPAVNEVTEEVKIDAAVPAVTSTSKILTADSSESVDLDVPDPDDFVAYADVTEKIAIDWAKAKLGDSALSAIEVSLNARIADQESPPAPTTGSGVPW